MATVGELLRVLEYRAHTLTRTPEDTVASHVAGWMGLAKATQHAIASLPLGGRSEVVKAGVRNVLAPLAHGPRDPLVGIDPAPQLTTLAQTMGGISDILADNLRAGGRAEQAGTEALKLEASLLSAVHVAARWSHGTMADQKLPTTRVSIMAFLDDLAVVTEPYALIPPGQRSSILEDFAVRAPNASGLDGVTVAWAEAAAATLGERYRVSGWAMQAIAGDLALLSLAARKAVLAAVSGELSPQNAAAISERLATSARSWRAAATWPRHLRLGGRASDLRAASRDIREAIVANPPQGVGEWRRVLGSVTPVALAHLAVMRRLVRGHELWIHGSALDPELGVALGWVREPQRSHEGAPLVKAAQAGYQALDCAMTMLGTTADASATTTARPRWAPETARQPNHPNDWIGLGAPVPSSRLSPRI